MSNGVENRVEPGLRVLVTAAGRGIGKAIADVFLEHGARVHICDLDPGRVEEFCAGRSNASASVCDVADPAQVVDLLSNVKDSMGGLDVLVNNAGIAGPVAPVGEIDPDDWDRTIAVDLNSHFYCANRAVPLLKAAGGGSIINIASTAGLFGCPYRSAYASAKWALIGLTKTMAMELGPDHIRVNAICPGSVDGERIRSVMEKDADQQGKSVDEILEDYLGQTSLGKLVSPEEVAALALFLISDMGSSISGQALSVDGNTESFALR
jgi:NAD(P)-dependent dehydrogenase (short-subunit alcohol dehydrogenase family)